ncbi:MAG: 16S rRNA (guanine(966)-N(2))-methyltransferase RsmD [Roseburia sp.]
MRIIAGKGRSLPLKTIEGMDTRPTTDRIKETLFNMLQSFLADCEFLDLFAGSGQIGLEAISRGAARAVFVENGKRAAECIKDNIFFTKFDDQCTLMNTDVMTALQRMEGREHFDIIFMDPPYGKLIEKEVLTYLSHSDIIDDGSLIVVEAALDTSFDYLDELGFVMEKLKTYKTNEHAFIRRM